MVTPAKTLSPSRVVATHFEHYRNRKDARDEHQERILEHLGYREFTAIESQQLWL